MTPPEYCVNWKNHMSHVRQAFESLFMTKDLTDVTLCCEDQKFQAHKILLSACSSYFRDIFKNDQCKHPTVIILGVESRVLEDILHFIYKGEVSIDPTKLDSFLKTAQMLQINGLTEHTNNEHVQIQEPRAQNAGADESSKGVKRVRTREPETNFREKISRPDDLLLVSDVKCEPSELLGLDDPLEDPLFQPEQQEDRKFFDTSGNHHPGEEELQLERERGFLESPSVIEVEAKVVKHSNFSEDCLKCNVCSKVFSHPYSLHHHKAVHSGNTECHICHAVLSRKYNLKMHMKARHNI